ncbi:MAG: 2-hydroxymuconate tautomerase [Enterococcus faecalis]|nr:2-hydroxymuconate tautomerase [Enterococcus faecalis]
MPFVHVVELIEGRTEEQLTNMVKDITEAVSKNAGAPKENIHVIVNELKKDRYAQGGEWKK